MNYSDVIQNRLAEQIALQIEHQIRLAIQPKPRWVPMWVWRRIVSRVLVLEYGKAIVVATPLAKA